MLVNFRADPVQEGAVRASQGQRTPGNRQPWKWGWFIGLIVVAGCGTVDTRNTDSTPWNGPTKAGTAEGWPDIQIRDSYINSPGGYYP